MLVYVIVAGDSRSNSSSRDIPYKTTNLLLEAGYSSWLPLPPPVSKGHKSSSSTPEEGDDAENSSLDVVKEAHAIKRPSKILSQRNVHGAKPPFFDRRTVFTKQAEPIFPKDPTSDMAKISRKSSKLVHEKQSMDKSYDRNSLPAGWLDCPPYGVALGFIIPSKVPLKESFNDKIIIDKRYSPQQAILQQRRLGRELGLVIDLTVGSQIGYDKIRCAGRESAPDSKSRSPDRDDDVASGLQDNGFQENQVTNVVGKGDTINVVGAGEMANAVREDEMENVTVPSEMTNDDILDYFQDHTLYLLAATGLMNINDDDRMTIMNYILDKMNWADFMSDIVEEIENNREVGFIQLHVRHLADKIFSWVFKKLDVSLVAVEDGDGEVLYELRDREFTLAVIQNKGESLKWKPTFGITALMISEHARFLPFKDLLAEKFIDGTKMLLSAEGEATGLMNINDDDRVTIMNYILDKMNWADFMSDFVEEIENNREVALAVIQNKGESLKWKPTFGITALMISEHARFLPFKDLLAEKFIDGTKMLLSAEGEDSVKEYVNVQAEEKGNDFDVNNSLDPFELYSILNKKKNVEEKMDKSNRTTKVLGLCWEGGGRIVGVVRSEGMAEKNVGSGVA
nr:mRNA-capping enzyme-like isoform X2 [Tanacetum cinerariifolium]